MANVKTTPKKLVNNVISKDVLRYIQRKVLDDLSNIMSCTYGPHGSSTLIIKGKSTDSNNIITEYSKDGKTVANSLNYAYPVEAAISSEICDITDYLEKTVGDGTTTAVVMGAAIFRFLMLINEDIEKINNNPYEIVRVFNKVVNDIKEEIQRNAREVKLEDIYDMAYISTNGNIEAAEMLHSIYEKYGFDVYIDAHTSINEETYLREYDGVTADVGFSDAMYVNSVSGECEIRDPEIYVFGDPVDTPEMIGYFEQILLNNIFIPFQQQKDVVPTVIVANKLSRDASPLMKQLGTILYQYDKKDLYTQKPPICVITDTTLYRDQFDDIARLCGSIVINKYINPEIQKADIEKGIAPTLETIRNFAGSTQKFVANAVRCKFINPKKMYFYDKQTKDGHYVHTPEYMSLLNYLESEYESGAKQGLNIIELGRLKRRINYLKGCMVEVFVGGISDSSRLLLKKSLDDAILNCRAAVKNGVGYAASFEGYRAIDKISTELNKKFANQCYVLNKYESIYDYCVKAIKYGYNTSILKLYGVEKDIIGKNILEESLKQQKPYNIFTNEYDGRVLCAINTDQAVLDAIAKIIMTLYTSNQAIVPSASLNVYSNIEIDEDEFLDE